MAHINDIENSPKEQDAVHLEKVNSIDVAKDEEQATVILTEEEKKIVKRAT